MKPKNLKRLFTFEHRRPLLEDCVFHLPLYYFDYHQLTLPSFCDFFGNENPVCVEYCSGNGDWIISRAKLQKEKNWIAVEKRFDRVQKIWSKLKNDQISNLLIVSGEAFTFTHHYLLSDCIEEIYINFPDPWPKTKHAKHRLLQSAFIDELSRVLKVGKRMTVVTDDLAYVMQTLSLFCRHSHFFPAYPAPHYTFDLPGYGDSWFENLWREKGKQIHYVQFIKHADSD